MLKYEDRIRDLEESVDKLKIEHRKEIDRLENNYSKNINDFEAQISKQRERTIKLINEKDAEVERFKSQNISNSESAVVASGAASSSSNYVNNEDAINNQESNYDESKILKMNSNLNETTLLHYSQELAFKDAELLKLRKLKNDLEYRIKNVISDNETELDNYRKQINLLKLEIERLKLNSTRLEASANMEYIKNVVYRFLTTKDVNVKLNMIQAIAQILQFTKHEKSKAININS
jgi:GRIP and coiled-coil domain-containing protein 1